MDNGVQHNKQVRGKISDVKLEQGSVIRIRGNPPFPSDKFHVFVVLNADPTGDCVLVTVNGTTQYEHRASVLRADWHPARQAAHAIHIGHWHL